MRFESPPSRGEHSKIIRPVLIVACLFLWCWFGHLRDGSAAAGTASSSFNPTAYSPGVGVRVSIVAVPDSANMVYAVEDTPPAGWTVSDIDNSGAFDNNNKKVKWGPYFDNTTRTLSYTATPPAGESGSRSFAGVASFDGVGVPIGGARTLSTVAAPDLSIAKSHAGDFAVGVNGSYALTVTNVGSAPTSGATTVTDILPAGLGCIAASGPGWTCSAAGQAVTCTSSNLLGIGAAGTITLTVSVAASAVPSVTNSATVSVSGDSNNANNTANDPTTVTGTLDLAISKSHAGYFTVGMNGSYSITIANVGSAPSSGTVIVTDTLPAGLSYVSASGAGWNCSASGQAVTCASSGTIAAGGTSVITLNVAVGASAVPSVTNSATVSATGDNNTANNTANDPTAVTGVPDLAVSKTHSGHFTAGGNGSYSIAVSNVGSAPTSGTIMVADTLPAGLSYISASGPGWNCSASGQAVTCTSSNSLGVGASGAISLSVSVGVAAIPSVTNSASVSAPGDNNTANNTSSDATTVTGVLDLSISKTHTGYFTVGVNGSYTLKVSNVGSSAASGTITVTDPLPTGLRYVSASGIDWACSASGQTVTCTNAASLAPGAGSSLLLSVAVDSAAAPSVTNTAAVTFSGDGNNANNSASDPTSVSTGPQTLTYVSPSSIVAGGSAFLLTVNGTNFNRTSLVLWNGVERTTYFSGSSQLGALISAADIANAGTASISVRDSTPGATATTPVTFTVLKILTTVSVPFTKADYSPNSVGIILAAYVTGISADAGNVTFQVRDGSALVGSAVTSGALVNRAANVYYTLPAGLRPAEYCIDATFNGTSNYASSQGFGTLKVYASDSNVLALRLPPEGGDSRISTAGAKLVAGYSALNSTLPANPVALANFGYSPVREAGPVLITEAGVPASSALTAARLLVDFSSSTDTGIAIINPNGSQGITLKAEFKDAAGRPIALSSIDLPPGGQKAVFAGQLAPELPRPFLGTLTLTSGDNAARAGPFAAVTLSTMTNGRGEILYSALPLVDLAVPSTGTNLIFPQIVDGEGISSQVFLMNPSGNSSAAGHIAFFDNDGNPLTLDFGDSGGVRSQLEFTLAPDGLVQFKTRGIGTVRVGYAVVTVTSGKLPSGSASFLFNKGSIAVSHAAVPGAIQTASARMFVEVSPSPLYRNTGLALVNPGLSTAVLALKLTGKDGKSITATAMLPAGAHFAKFLDELFPGRMPAEFRGVLDVSSSIPIAPLLLRLTVNQRGEAIYSTLPVADLINPPRGKQYLPQIVDGEGYQTQILMINTTVDEGTVYADLLDALGKSLRIGFR